MLANLGFGALIITFLVSLFGIGAAVYGVRSNKSAWIDSARNAMLLTFPLISLTVLSLIILLITNHYEVQYVSSVTSTTMPLYLKVTALWGGQAGSLIFWSWLLSLFASAVMLRKWDRDREFLPWVIVVALVTLVFFLFMSIFIENPFTRYWQTATGIITAFFQPSGSIPFAPVDGSGLNPLLRHPGMVFHPPMLYLGFVAFVIPYAFAIAALITGRTDDRWIRITRRWTLIAWLFLSLGLLLGGRWAYDVLGWGGYWGWDPVEISAFMPWLTGTAFLHSVMIQEKRGMFKHWNMILIILTYDLVIFGTFLTRSGVLSSVHAFAQSAIGPIFFAYIGLTFIVSLTLVLRRWNDLKSETQMTSLLSREFLFLLNNLLFMSILVVCFWGVIFPLISEVLTDIKKTVGPAFYEPATAPLFAGLLLLVGICPLAAWQYSTAKTIGRAIWKPFLVSLIVPLIFIITGMRSVTAILGLWLCAYAIAVIVYEFWRGARARHRSVGESFPVALWHLTTRNRRRYGGYLIHLSIVLMAIGVIGIELFQTETQGTIPQGGQLSLGHYTMTFDSLVVDQSDPGREVAKAVITISKDGKIIDQVQPHRDYYYDSEQFMTIPGVHSTLEDDLYIILVDWQPISSQGATFKIYHNPLVNWLWLGGILLILGTLIAAWPEKSTESVSVAARKSSFQGVEA